MTNIVSGCTLLEITEADHLNLVEPPLTQQSQNIYSGISLKLTLREAQGKINKTAGDDHLSPGEPQLAQPSQI